MLRLWTNHEYIKHIYKVFNEHEKYVRKLYKDVEKTSLTRCENEFSCFPDIITESFFPFEW